MSTVQILIDGRDYSKYVIYETASFSSNVKAQPGNFAIELKDLDETFNFDGGEHVKLRIDGRNYFGGFVTTVTKTNFLDHDPKYRKWVLIGLDYNMIFDRLVAYNHEDGTKDLRYYKPDTTEGVVVRNALRHYYDVPVGMDYNHHVQSDAQIETDIPFQGAGIGDTIRQFLSRMARVTESVYFIDPDFKLHVQARDAGNSPYIFSNEHGTDSPYPYIPYSNVTIEEDITSLQNDVLTWGNRAEPIVFARRSNNTSIAKYGRLQFGEWSTERFKQSSVDARARSVINRRGNLPIRTVHCLTFRSGPRVGDSPRFVDSEFDINEILIVKEMTITFPSPRHPQFEMSLGLQPEDPYGLVDVLPYDGLDIFTGIPFDQGSDDTPHMPTPEFTWLYGQQTGQMTTTPTGRFTAYRVYDHETFRVATNLYICCPYMGIMGCSGMNQAMVTQQVPYAKQSIHVTQAGYTSGIIGPYYRLVASQGTQDCFSYCSGGAFAIWEQRRLFYVYQKGSYGLLNLQDPYNYLQATIGLKRLTGAEVWGQPAGTGSTYTYDGEAPEGIRVGLWRFRIPSGSQIYPYGGAPSSSYDSEDDNCTSWLSWIWGPGTAGAERLGTVGPSTAAAGEWAYFNIPFKRGFDDGYSDWVYYLAVEQEFGYQALYGDDANGPMTYGYHGPTNPGNWPGREGGSTMYSPGLATCLFFGGITMSFPHHYAIEASLALNAAEYGYTFNSGTPWFEDWPDHNVIKADWEEDLPKGWCQEVPKPYQNTDGWDYNEKTWLVQWPFDPNTLKVYIGGHLLKVGEDYSIGPLDSEYGWPRSFILADKWMAEDGIYLNEDEFWGPVFEEYNGRDIWITYYSPSESQIQHRRPPVRMD